MAYPQSLSAADIRDYATSCGLDPDIAVAQLSRESSGFNCLLTGASGEKGLAQFMPATWAAYGSGDPFDCYDSLGAWCAYMLDLLNQTGGAYYDALRMYNGGYSNSVRSNNYATAVLQAAGKDLGYMVGDAPGGGAPSVAGGMTLLFVVGGLLLAAYALS